MAEILDSPSFPTTRDSLKRRPSDDKYLRGKREKVTAANTNVDLKALSSDIIAIEVVKAQSEHFRLINMAVTIDHDGLFTRTLSEADAEPQK